MRNLKEKNKQERQDKLAAGVLLLYEKAPVHTVRVTKAVALDCGFINIIQLADLAPRYYYLLSNLKNIFVGNDLSMKVLFYTYLENV